MINGQIIAIATVFQSIEEKNVYHTELAFGDGLMGELRQLTTEKADDAIWFDALFELFSSLLIWKLFYKFKLEKMSVKPEKGLIIRII